LLEVFEKYSDESEEFCGKFPARQNDDKSLVPDYAKKACGGKGKGKNGDLIAQVSSACACVPTTILKLSRTTSRPPVLTVLPPRL
jgi:hypothetical protein